MNPPAATSPDGTVLPTPGPEEETAPPASRALLTGLVMLPLLVAFGWLVSKAQWYWNHQPDLQFGWIVLGLCAFVAWDQWERRPPLVCQARWPFFLGSLAGCAVLFTMQLYQAAFGLTPAVMMGLTTGLYAIALANIHYAAGWPGVRFYAFPLLFFLIALPLPSFLYNPLVHGLQEKVATVNVEILNLIGVPAHRSGSLIELPNGTVGVNEACSGIRSLQSTVMATLFIGYLTLQRRSLQVMLLGLGIGLAIFGNLVRSLYLSLTANAKGLAAVDKVHDSAGWTILLFTAAGVALLAWMFHKLELWAKREEERLKAKG